MLLVIAPAVEAWARARLADVLAREMERSLDLGDQKSLGSFGLSPTQPRQVLARVLGAYARQKLRHPLDYVGTSFVDVDTWNRMNPLSYCETLYACNPCGEQPLPPNGACLLLSLNAVKYLVPSYSGVRWELDLDRLRHDVDVSVRACDNVFENTYEESRVPEPGLFYRLRK